MIKFSGIRRTAVYLTLLTVVMFGFGYALVPLYDVFCEVTGLNGKTGRIYNAEVSKLIVDTERFVIIHFDSNINGNLAWKLKANQKFLMVNPGKFYEVTYTVENMINEEIVGQAIPSVTPQIASLYLKKSECFCFRNQVLKPGEKKNLTVRFEVDKDIPKNVESLTLSYTFFRVLKEDKKVS
jgi:cytochrome c oxidase assembly protein subunit 11